MRLGTVHAEAGNGIEASDAPDVSKPQPFADRFEAGAVCSASCFATAQLFAHSMKMLLAKMGQVKQKEEQEGKVET